MAHRRAFALPLIAAFVALLGSLLGPLSVAAESTTLDDSITAGVVRTNDGFGTSTVIVPVGGYVTYLVRTAPSLAGTRLEIWTNTGSGWQYATARTIAPDGTVHYFVRISRRTGFQARLAGDATTPATRSHARSAANWPAATDRRTLISVGCDDFVPDTFARPDDNNSALVERTVGVTPGTQLDVVLCSNASTGFGWETAAIDSAHLRLLGHHYVNISDFVGAPGTETWSFLVTAHGEGHAMLAYSQPWAGGTKAAWSFVLTLR
jgi:predicted secreted protein